MVVNILEERRYYHRMKPMDTRSPDDGPFTFRDLLVWKKSRALAVNIYRLTDTEKLARRHAYCDQLGRAALSVPSNIAEGNDRGTNKESLRFLLIARGSLSELETQLGVGYDLGWIDEESHRLLVEQRSEVARLLGGLIRMRQERLRSSAS